MVESPWSPPEDAALYALCRRHSGTAHARVPGAALLVSPEELFEGMRAATRELDFRSNVRFAVDSRHILAGVDRYLPRDGEDVQGFLSRVERQVEGRSFALIVGDVQAFSPVLWRRGRELAARFYSRHGARARARFTAFLGRYVVTPFGLHWDRPHEAVLQFPIMGSRTVHTWPRGHFGDERREAALLHTLDYEPYLATADSRTAAPGEVVGWSGERWHLVTPALGGYTAAVSLVFERTPLTVQHVLRESALESWRDALDAGDVPGDGDGPLESERLLASLGALERRLPLGDAEVVARAIRQYLRRRTSFGFHPPAPLAEVEIAEETPWRREPRHGLMMAQHEGVLFVAGNGHLLEVSDTPEARALLAELDSTEPVTLARLNREYGRRGLGAEDVRELLATLAGFRVMQSLA